jgi:Protein of unknown function (DUF1194)
LDGVSRGWLAPFLFDDVNRGATLTIGAALAPPARGSTLDGTNHKIALCPKLRTGIASFVMACGLALGAPTTRADDSIAVDTALILAVDVSNSVDQSRYRLQMEGIAQALEDTGVINAILAGPRRGIALALVTWTDHAEIALPWQSIRSADDAKAFAALVRQVPQKTGEYTCVSRMLEKIRQTIVSDIPAKADRIVLDVSGDGIDNCGQPGDSANERDQLVAMGITINGLPIIVKGENDIVGSGAYRAPGYGLKELPIQDQSMTTTLDAWYKANVVGGTSGFLLTANGFEDFGRAFRQKFVSEISALEQRPIEPAIVRTLSATQ